MEVAGIFATIRAMKIEHDIRSGVVCLALAGRFDEFAVPEAEKAFADAVNHEHVRVLLDLSGVEYVTSSGLRAILMLHRAVGNRAGALRLCGLTPFVAQVFDVSNFTSLFEIHPTRDAALKSLA